MFVLSYRIMWIGVQGSILFKSRCICMSQDGEEKNSQKEIQLITTRRLCWSLPISIIYFFNTTITSDAQFSDQARKLKFTTLTSWLKYQLQKWAVTVDKRSRREGLGETKKSKGQNRDKDIEGLVGQEFMPLGCSNR